MFAGRPRQRKRSQSIVEFALILPTMILLLLGSIDFGRMFYDLVALNGAASAGSLVAMEWQRSLPPSSPAQANQAARDAIKRSTNPDVFPFFTIADSDIDLDILWLPDLEYRITVTRRFIFYTPLATQLFAGGDPLNLSVTVRGRHHIL